MGNITPEQQAILDQAKLINNELNPEGAEVKKEKEEGEDGVDYKKRFTDTQGAFTKAQEHKIEMAKMLVEQNPANVEKIPDEKIKIKVLQEKWGVDTVEELKVMFPNYAKSQDDDSDDATDLEKVQRELKLMKYQGAKTKTNEEINNVMTLNKEFVATIPEFETKLREQMKNISEDVLPKDRVNMAFKLVLGTSGQSASAYGAMQGITGFSASKDEKPVEKKLDNSVVKDIMSKRRM